MSFLKFLSNGGGWDCSSQPNVLPKLIKITVTCPKLVKKTIGVNYDLLKVSKMTNNFDLLNVSKMSSFRVYVSPVMEKLETLNLNTRVNLIQRVLLGTPP